MANQVVYLKGQEGQLLYQGNLLSLVGGVAPSINMDLEGGRAPLLLVHQADLLLYISFQVRKSLPSPPKLIDTLQTAFFKYDFW